MFSIVQFVAWRESECKEPGSEVMKLFFNLNSVEHDILTAHEYQNSQINEISKLNSSKQVIHSAD